MLKIKVIIYSLINDIRNFSFGFAFFNILYLCFSNVNNMSIKNDSNIYKKVSYLRNRSITKYLKKQFGFIIDNYKNIPLELDGGDTRNSPIWMIWWQGYENAPDIIKACTESKKKYLNNHPLIIITQENFEQFITIPRHILDKVANKKFSITHLSDIIRVSLLAQYGGLWLDASVFCCDIPEHIFEQNFFTCKNPKTITNISENKWTTYALASQKNNKLFLFLRDFFFEYCKQKSKFIDYFLFDHLINLAYNEFPDIKEMIDNVPINNKNCERLSARLNCAFNKREYDKIKDKNNFWFKLAWNCKLNEYTDNQEKTYYYYLKNNQI